MRSAWPSICPIRNLPWGLYTFIYCLWGLLVSTVAAQPTDHGEIHGRILDRNGAPLPYASVRIIDFPYGSLADTAGAFVLTLPAGHYPLEAVLNIRFVSKEKLPGRYNADVPGLKVQLPAFPTRDNGSRL